MDKSLVDIRLQHRANQIHCYLAFKSKSLRKRLIKHQPKCITFCRLVDPSEYNILCKRCYDRSAFRNKTKWIEIFGIPAPKLSDEPNESTKSQKESAQQIEEIISNEMCRHIVSIRVIHNVRFPKMFGFALIEMDNEQHAVNVVDGIRNTFKGHSDLWSEFVNPSLMKNRAVLHRIHCHP